MDLAARAAIVQPALDGDLFALVPADVFDVHVHMSTWARLKGLRCDFRHVRPVMAYVVRSRSIRSRAFLAFSSVSRGDARAAISSRKVPSYPIFCTDVR